MTIDLPRTQHSAGGAATPPPRRMDSAGDGRAEHRTGAAGGSERWNFNVLLGAGASAGTAFSIAGPQVVLPFLYMALGAPVFFAGLLLPAAKVGKLVAQVIAAPFISATIRRKTYLTLGAMTMAAALAIIGLSVELAPVDWLAPVFLLAAVLLGTGSGVNNVAFQDMLGRILPSHRRPTLLYTTAALAGALAIIISLGTQYFHGAADALRSHILLLWAGAGAFVLMGTLSAILREPPTASPSAQAEAKPEAVKPGKGYIEELRTGIAMAGKVPWFRRYLVAQVLYLSVGMSLPFYSLHAATLHQNTAGSLAAFVIASSAGMIAAGPLWRRVGRTSIRLVMLLSALMAAAAGVLALVIETVPDLQLPLVHSAVFFLVSIAFQGVSNALRLYLVELSPESDRTYFIAVSSTVWCGAGILVALAFGALAHVQHAAWPIMCIVGLNIAACLYTLRLEPVRGAEAPLPRPPGTEDGEGIA